MGKKNRNSQKQQQKQPQPVIPLVTICTPTFNRRPFIPMMIKCFQHQTYPKNRIEWLILDDGTDKIEDLVSHMPEVKYLKYDEKMTLGKKRNIMNDLAKGDYIIYMDDDDYHPPDRIQHAVDKLRNNSTALCAGSSAMFLYFKHISKMYQFGPYGPNHSTAATFAFKKELLKITRFNEESSVAEEKQFLKDYTIPFVQLEPTKTIVVFSHDHNSFDKKELLEQLPSPYIHETNVVPSDIIKEADILQFFMVDIDALIGNYDAGKPHHKPDVIKQLAKIRETRQQMIEEHIKQQEAMNKINLLSNPQLCQQKIDELTAIIQHFATENNELKNHINYLNDKIKELVATVIQLKSGTSANIV